MWCRRPELSLYNKRILLVGQQISSLRSIAQACRGTGFSIIIAPEIKYALDEMNLRHFDFFIFDLDMGCQICRELVQMVGRKVPCATLVFLCQDYEGSHRLILKSRGTNVYGEWHILEKPQSVDVLIQLIKQLLVDETERLQDGQLLDSSAGFDRRDAVRKSFFLPIRFSYERLENDNKVQTLSCGLLVDIGSGGIGLMTNRHLAKQQCINFENTILCGSGVVAWNAAFDDLPHKVGIKFC